MLKFPDLNLRTYFASITIDHRTDDLVLKTVGHTNIKR